MKDSASMQRSSNGLKRIIVLLGARRDWFMVVVMATLRSRSSMSFAKSSTKLSGFIGKTTSPCPQPHQGATSPTTCRTLHDIA